MRTLIHPHGLTLWLSARDTYEWANRAGARWPCSELSGKRLVACFDRNGLCDIAINGKSDADVSSTEFNAITSDFLRNKLPKDHPCYLVCVGQFEAAL
jgi:hypothetical protein